MWLLCPCCAVFSNSGDFVFVWCLDSGAAHKSGRRAESVSTAVEQIFILCYSWDVGEDSDDSFFC